jgi:hypothetical protein
MGELHLRRSPTVVERRWLLLPQARRDGHAGKPRIGGRERRRHRGRGAPCSGHGQGCDERVVGGGSGEGVCYIRHSILLQHKFLDVAKLYTCFNNCFRCFVSYLFILHDILRCFIGCDLMWHELI